MKIDIEEIKKQEYHKRAKIFIVGTRKSKPTADGYFLHSNIFWNSMSDITGYKFPLDNDKKGKEIELLFQKGIYLTEFVDPFHEDNLNNNNTTDRTITAKELIQGVKSLRERIEEAEELKIIAILGKTAVLCFFHRFAEVIVLKENFPIKKIPYSTDGDTCSENFYFTKNGNKIPVYVIPDTRQFTQLQLDKFSQEVNHLNIF